MVLLLLYVFRDKALILVLLKMQDNGSCIIDPPLLKINMEDFYLVLAYLDS